MKSWHLKTIFSSTYDCVMIKFINWAAKGGPVFGPVMLEIRVSQTLAHPRRPGGSQSGREKMRDKSFRTISKNSSGCRLLIGHKNCFLLLCPLANSFSWVLFVSSYTMAYIVSPHLPCLFSKLVRARETFIFYFPNQKQRNYRWVEKTVRMLSAGAFESGPNILVLTDLNVF